MQLEVTTLESGRSDFRWGICLTATNTSDVNGTPLTWKPYAAFGDATQIFRLGQPSRRAGGVSRPWLPRQPGPALA
jgi:hypothetical protein